MIGLRQQPWNRFRSPRGSLLRGSPLRDLGHWYHEDMKPWSTGPLSFHNDIPLVMFIAADLLFEDSFFKLIVKVFNQLCYCSSKMQRKLASANWPTSSQIRSFQVCLNAIEKADLHWRKPPTLAHQAPSLFLGSWTDCVDSSMPQRKVLVKLDQVANAKDVGPETLG